MHCTNPPWHSKSINLSGELYIRSHAWTRGGRTDQNRCPLLASYLFAVLQTLIKIKT